MKRPTYAEAITWIAHNDNAGDNESAEMLSGYTSVALVADLFGIEQSKAGKDVFDVRNNSMPIERRARYRFRGE